jgi:hypothetical protein
MTSMLTVYNATMGHTNIVGDGDLFLSWTPGKATAWLQRTNYEDVELRVDREVYSVSVSYHLSVPDGLSEMILSIVASMRITPGDISCCSWWTVDH